MQSSATPTHKTGRSSRLTVFVLVIVCLSLLGWIYVHNLALDEPESSLSRQSDLEISTEQIKKIEQLIAQTKALANDLTIRDSSQETVGKLRMIGNEEIELQKHAQSLRQEIQHVQDDLHSCQRQSLALQAKYESAINTIASGSVTQVIAPIAAASRAVENPPPQRWLAIGIPTVARRNHEEYLLHSLEAIRSQLPADPDDLLYQQVVINVVNMQVNADSSRQHIVFDKARDIYKSNPSFEFEILRQDEILPDPLPNRNAHNDLGSANKPGFLVRRQTRNIVAVMRRNVHKAKYFLFLEDDMKLCPNGFLAMQYLLAKASRYHPDWLAIRASYGMNGIFMRDKDLDVFAKYLIDHQARRPPDHLVVEWYAGETAEAKNHKGSRANIGFKHNLFDHLGVVSTLRSQHQTSFPRCYELLVEPTVFKVEAFSPAECPRDDVWPCKVEHPELALVSWRG